MAAIEPHEQAQGLCTSHPSARHDSAQLVRRYPPQCAGYRTCRSGPSPTYFTDPMPTPRLRSRRRAAYARHLSCSRTNISPRSCRGRSGCSSRGRSDIHHAGPCRSAVVERRFRNGHPDSDPIGARPTPPAIRAITAVTHVATRMKPVPRPGPSCLEYDSGRNVGKYDSESATSLPTPQEHPSITWQSIDSPLAWVLSYVGCADEPRCAVLIELPRRGVCLGCQHGREAAPSWRIGPTSNPAPCGSIKGS